MSWLPWLSKLQMNQLKHFKVTLIPGVKWTVPQTADAANEELRFHLTLHNTSQTGVISWIKRDVTSTAVKPEALNLKEAMKYIFDHQDCESNGYALFDSMLKTWIFSSRELSLLRAKKTPISDYKPLTQKYLSCPQYERLKLRITRTDCLLKSIILSSSNHWHQICKHQHIFLSE